MAAVAGQVTHFHLVFLRFKLADVTRIVGIVARTHLSQLAMQVYDVMTAGTFVQIVNVLRNDSHIEILFQFSAENVTLVGFDFEQLLAALVVKMDNQFRIGHVAFD